MKRIFFASALALSATFGAQAEMVSLDSNFGDDTITYDTNSGLGWLDLVITDKISYNTLMERLDSNAAYSNFRLASYDEYNAMLNDVFPSLFTANQFYLGRDSSPKVNIEEGLSFRTLFGNGTQVIMGKTSDGTTLKWAGSNSWSTGYIGYTDIYSDPQGRALDESRTHGASSQEAGWFLVSTGTANLTTGTFIASDVPTPFMAFAGLGLLALGMRRKKH
jgi:hypothetical protein